MAAIDDCTPGAGEHFPITGGTLADPVYLTTDLACEATEASTPFAIEAGHDLVILIKGYTVELPHDDGEAEDVSEDVEVLPSTGVRQRADLRAPLLVVLAALGALIAARVNPVSSPLTLITR